MVAIREHASRALQHAIQSARDPHAQTFHRPAERELVPRLDDGFPFRLEVVGDDPAVASGRIHYDGDVAGTCVAALRGATCGSSNQVFRDQCAAVFVGAVAIGDACADDDECAAGLCDQTAGAAEGTCATPPTAGMACVDEACAASAYCEFQPATSQYLCVAKLADGGLCTSDQACLSGYCDDASRCGPPPPSMTCDGA